MGESLYLLRVFVNTGSISVWQTETLRGNADQSLSVKRISSESAVMSGHIAIDLSLLLSIAYDYSDGSPRAWFLEGPIRCTRRLAVFSPNGTKPGSMGLIPLGFVLSNSAVHGPGALQTNSPVPLEEK